MSCSYWAWHFCADVDGISTLSPKKKNNFRYVELNEKGTLLIGTVNGASVCVYRYLKHLHQH